MEFVRYCDYIFGYLSALVVFYNVYAIPLTFNFILCHFNHWLCSSTH